MKRKTGHLQSQYRQPLPGGRREQERLRREENRLRSEENRRRSSNRPPDPDDLRGLLVPVTSPLDVPTYVRPEIRTGES